MEDVGLPWPFGLFYGCKVYFMAISYIFGHLVHFRSFGIFFPVLVCCAKKNLATLVGSWNRAHLRPLEDDDEGEQADNAQLSAAVDAENDVPARRNLWHAHDRNVSVRRCNTEAGQLDDVGDL
jgi:hypothetical protein